MKMGIVVREENGIIDWKQGRNAIDFALLCCGRGSNVNEETEVDSQFHRNVAACVEEQIPFGVYWYSRSTSASHMENELETTVSELQKLPKKTRISYPILLYLGDCETTLALQRDTIAQLAKLYCDGIKHAGYEPGIYANKYWHTHLLADSCFNNWKKCVIQYHKECTYSGAFMMWEYTSLGKVKGVKGYVKRLVLCEENPWNRKRYECIELPNLQGYVGDSIVGALNQKGYASDYETRTRLALQTGMVSQPGEYKGNSQQNRGLLRKLGGTVSVSRMLREGTYIKLKAGSVNYNTDVAFDRDVYNNTFQVISVSGTTVVFGIEGTIIGTVNRNSVVVI